MTGIFISEKNLVIIHQYINIQNSCVVLCWNLVLRNGNQQPKLPVDPNSGTMSSVCRYFSIKTHLKFWQKSHWAKFKSRNPSGKHLSVSDKIFDHVGWSSPWRAPAAWSETRAQAGAGRGAQAQAHQGDRHEGGQAGEHQQDLWHITHRLWSKAKDKLHFSVVTGVSVA